MKLHNHFLDHKLTLIRTCIFTAGHYWIDVLSNHFITGAPIKLAMFSSIAGPILNAIWYYILDRVFFTFLVNKIKNKKHVV